jgi:hypothetical protein
VWHGKEAVLGVSTDEMIDNTEIIIKFKDGEFTKTPISRYLNYDLWNTKSPIQKVRFV